MSNKSDTPSARHLSIVEPSPWVLRFSPLVRQDGTVLDLACGGGRHAQHFIDLGCRVVMLDRVIQPIEHLAGHPKVEIVEADLESGNPWPFEGRTFAAIVVVNYLYRPLFANLLASIDDGGVLIYETFARGNERFNRPRNPDHLLKSGELLETVGGKLHVIAYEHGMIDEGSLSGVKQRLCAINTLRFSARDDDEPEPRPVFPSAAKRSSLK